MKTRSRGVNWLIGVAVVLSVASFAMATSKTFDFEGTEYGTNDPTCSGTAFPTGFQPPMFNMAIYAIQTTAYVDGAAECGGGALGASPVNVGSYSFLTNYYSLSPSKSEEIRFSWKDPNDANSWARVQAFSVGSTQKIPVSANPTIDIRAGSSVKINFLVYLTDATEVENTTGNIEVALAIRETGLNLPLGADGSSSGSVEFVGVTTTTGTDKIPTGGTVLNDDYAWHSIEWTFKNDSQVPPKVTLVDVSVDGGPATELKIADFAGDSELSAAYNRGTLDSLVVIKGASDTTTKKVFINVDDIEIKAPGVATEPVQVVSPIVSYMTEATVKLVDPTATLVTLYKNGSAAASVNPSGATEVTFTGLTFAAGDQITATQTIGSEGDPSAPVTVVSPVVWSDNFDSYTDDTTFTAVWKKGVGSDGVSTDLPAALTSAESASCSNSANIIGTTVTYPARRYVHLSQAAGITGLNGTDAVPLWCTFYFRHLSDGGTGTRTGVGFFNCLNTNVPTSSNISHYYELGCYNGTAPTTNYTFRDSLDSGPGWVATSITRGNDVWHKMQIKLTASATTVYVDDVQAYTGTRFGPNEPITTITLGIGLGTAGRDSWVDNVSLSVGPTATDPFGAPLPSPTISGTHIPTPNPTTVTVNNIDVTATLVKVYADATLIGSEAVSAETSKVVNVSNLPNNATLTATQVIDSVESCRSASKGALSGVPAPGVQSPLQAGVTTVTVTGIDAGATLVKVFVNGSLAGSADPAGAATKAVTVAALNNGEVVTATQTVNGYESLQTNPGVTVFTQGVGSLKVCLAVREQSGLTGPAGATYTTGSSAGITWIGTTTSGLISCQPVDSCQSAPQGKLITPGTGWQQLSFWASNHGGTDGYRAFTGGGTLPYQYAVMEHWALKIMDGKVGPYTLYLDDMENGGAIYENFDSAANGAAMIFRAPTYSGTSYPCHIMGSPNYAGVSTAEKYSGTKSLKIQYQYKDTTDCRFVRLTSSGTSTSLHQSPIVDLNTPHLARFKLCAADPVGIGNILAVGGTVVTVTGVFPAADMVKVYDNGALVGSAAGNMTTTVDVTVPAMAEGHLITASQVLGGIEGCIDVAGKTVGACSQVANPVVNGPLAAGNTTVAISGIDGSASLVEVFANGSSIGTIANPSATTYDVEVTALVAGDVITVKQTLSNVTSCGSASAVVGSGANAGLLVSLGIRENTSLTGPLGAAGGTTGTVEWLGVTSVISGAPQGKPLNVSPDWQTVTFNMSEGVTAYPGSGDGTLLGTWGAIDHLGITCTGTESGPYKLYVDNVKNDTTVFATFESPFTVDQAVMFQNPAYVSATSVTPGTAFSKCDVAHGDASAQSQRLEWQFAATGNTQWVRVTTAGTLSGLGTPMVEVAKDISFRLLLCNPATVDSIDPTSGSAGAVSLTINGANFSTTDASVKLVLGANVFDGTITSNDGSVITADFDLTGADAGAYDVVVTVPCGQATLAAAFTVSGGPGCNTPKMDTNGDLHVDATDFDTFSACYNGPTNAPRGDCTCLDSNGDSHVDATDFDVFSACYNGPTNAPRCAE